MTLLFSADRREGSRETTCARAMASGTLGPAQAPAGCCSLLGPFTHFLFSPEGSVSSAWS